jgi:hypothetical protein
MIERSHLTHMVSAANPGAHHQHIARVHGLAFSEQKAATDKAGRIPSRSTDGSTIAGTSQ